MIQQDIYKDIYEAAVKFMVPQDIEETYMSIAKEAMNLVDGAYASIFLFQDGNLKKVYASDEKLKSITPRKEGSTYETFHSGLAQLRHKSELLDANNKFKEFPVESNISLPLIYGHITIGVLSVLSKKSNQFTRDDLSRLILFAPLATMAIRKNQYIEEAERAISSRDLFISLAEHELKNPLTLLALNVELLMKSKSLIKPKEFKRIQTIETTTNRLINLVDELLISGGKKEGKLKYSFNSCDLVQLAKQTVDELSLQHKYREIKFKNSSLQKMIQVSVDKDKIKQVIINLVNNALKFSRQSMPVTISLEIKGDLAFVKVSDKGIGISVNDLPKVFKRYYSGNSNERGLGIGLYLVKKIITKHKGEVNIESTLGEGTTVSFTLPIIDERKTRSSRDTGK